MPIVEGSQFDAILEHRANDSVFIETGTALGETTRFMADHFDMVYSIEFDNDLYWSTFQRTHTIPNIRLINGDSADYLKRLDYLMPESVTYFLDAHSVDNPNSPVAPSGYTPIKDELAIVLNSKKNVVIVDDARLFDGKQYPTVAAVRKFASGRKYEMIEEGDLLIFTHKELT